MQSSECEITISRLAILTRDLDSNDLLSCSNAYRDMLVIAQRGNSDAMFQVARCLKRGIGVEVDLVKADHWLRMACVTKPASKVAMYTFGMQHLLHQRTDACAATGLSFIEQAASQGYVKATLEFVNVLEHGVLDIKPDLRRAYRMLASSIDNEADEVLYQAYASFIERNKPITHLLDS